MAVTDDSGIYSKSNSDNLKVVINAKPIADAGPDRLVIPEEIIPFNAQNSFDSDGKIVNWHWDFGNSDSSDKEKPFYAFKQPGVYRVKLRVGDDTGHSEAIGFDEAIITVNAPPIARAGVDIHTIPNKLVKLDAAASYDPDGKIISYQWIFSDGKVAKTRKVKRSFAKSGIYTAQLQITDNSGASNSIAEDSLTIYVNHQPIARIGKETDSFMLTNAHNSTHKSG
jgi:PKD repeat protein